MELDEKSFKELIHRQRDLIWRVCSGYRLSAAWTTEDAFHEVLCELWRGYHRLRGTIPAIATAITVTLWI